MNDSQYRGYGLREPVRDDIATKMENGVTFSDRASNYYDRLMTLCRLIDEGDTSIGLPPYNGGLFAAEAAPILGDARLPDATIAPLVYDLSHSDEEDGRRFISYRGHVCAAARLDLRAPAGAGTGPQL